jgi:hypothetical protein
MLEAASRPNRDGGDAAPGHDISFLRSFVPWFKR